MNNNKPSVLVSALSAAVFFDGLVFLLSWYFLPDAQFWAVLFALPFMPVLFVAAPNVYHYVNHFKVAQQDKQIDSLSREIELFRLKETYKTLKANGSLPTFTKQPTIIDSKSEKLRRAKYRGYWIKVCEYVLAHNSIFSWRDKDGNGLNKIIPKYEVWYATVAMPFAKNNPAWLTPVFQGSKTRLPPDLTVQHILACLSAGIMPELPEGDPPTLISPNDYGEAEEFGTLYSSNTMVENSRQLSV